MDEREDLLEQALTELYQHKYGVEADHLYMHLYLRYLFLHMKNGRIKPPKIAERNRNLATFLVDDLHLRQDKEGNLTLNNQPISGKHSWGSPLQNIFDNWTFRTEIIVTDWPFVVDEVIATCTKKARKKSWAYTETPIRQLVYQQEVLRTLVEQFEVASRTTPSLQLQQDKEKLNLEEKLDKKIQEWKNKPHTSVRITEAQLEEFVYRNLERIEPGLTPVQQQTVLSDGRVDIWARDASERDTLLELKVRMDTDIVWQRIYYESEWRKTRGKPRMILVLPELEPHIEDALKKAGETEVLLYEAIVRDDRVEDIRIKRKICIK